MSNRFDRWDEYGFRHTSHHLLSHKRWGEAGNLLYDLEFMEATIRRLGIDELLQEYAVALRFLPKGEDWRDKLEATNRTLDRQAHHLRDWDAQVQPSFFLQQLRNESLELGLSGQQARAEAELAKLGWPHLYERFKVNRESPELVRTLMGHSDSVRCVALSADGRLAVSASGRYDGLGELKVWDVVTGRELRTLVMHPDGVEVKAVALRADVRLADSE